MFLFKSFLIFIKGEQFLDVEIMKEEHEKLKIILY